MARTFSKVSPKAARWRIWVQAAFLLVWLDPATLFTSLYAPLASRLPFLPQLSAFAFRFHNVCGPVFHCYACPLALFACPVGVLANFSALHVFPFFALGTLVLAGAIFGGFICGWACPFGFLQDLIGRIPVPKVELPRWTGHFRYAVLGVLVLAVPFLYGESHPLFICRLCPAGTLEGAMYNVGAAAVKGTALPWPSATKLIILGLLVAAMLVKWRPWCALFCPLGAIFGLFRRVSAVFLRVEPKDCVSCGLCSEQCRYGIVPDEDISNPHCVHCLECTRCSAIRVRTLFSPPEEPAVNVETPASAPPRT